MAAIGISLKPETNMLNTGATRNGDFMSHRCHLYVIVQR